MRNNKYELDVINEWAQGFIDRDGKFVKEFQLSFNSCFWELYLFAAFKQIGASVDFSYAAPDFLVSSDKQTFIAEAVIASHAQGYAPEWEREVTMDAIEDLDLSVLVSYSAIRLANAITSKHKKHVHGYAHLPHVKGRPFVLCLAAFEQPYFYAQNTQALSRVLYGYDKPIVIKKPDSGESFLVGETWAEVEVKESGSEIELGFFTDERMSEISAVIFSTTATYGKIQALRADMDALILFHAQKYNPYSINPSVVQEIKKDYEETLLGSFREINKEKDRIRGWE